MDAKHFNCFKDKENAIVLACVLFIFIVVGLVGNIVYTSLIDKIKLEMKFSSEKSFNSVYMSLEDFDGDKASRTMKEEGVRGIGFYSASGRLYVGYGNIPNQIPLAKLSASKKTGSDSTLGCYLFDRNTHIIEYFRLSRLNVALETGSIGINGNAMSPLPSDFPEIIYIQFDGSKYYNAIRTVRIGTILSAVILFIFIVVLLFTYVSNRSYKKALLQNERLASLGSAARTLTHEIKNPLSAMTIQSALMRKILPEEYHSDLDIMDHEIKRLTALTNRVSEFLKDPVGNNDRIELVSFITEIISLFPCNIPFSHSVDCAYTIFDYDRARSVFENIVKNACESRSDGSDASVEILLKIVRKNKVVVQVMDRGDGLPHDKLENMFDPFFTTKIHGSGIGLSISKQFVQARGGSLKLYDRQGGGTVAEIALKHDTVSDNALLETKK